MLRQWLVSLAQHDASIFAFARRGGKAEQFLKIAFPAGTW